VRLPGIGCREPIGGTADAFIVGQRSEIFQPGLATFDVVWPRMLALMAGLRLRDVRRNTIA
jgi:hypothetical protein